MPVFFTRNIEPAAGRAVIEGEDAKHLSLSLRVRPGEALTVCDGAGTNYAGVIAAVGRERVEISIQEGVPSPGEPSVRLTLYQALCKGEKFETIVQKAVELGVERIVPVLTERCVSRPDETSFARKRERYERIAFAAAGQCGRGRIPSVEPLRRLEELGDVLCGALFFYERAVRPLHSVPVGGRRELSLIVGAEGGFSPEEASFIEAAGAVPVSLGGRILRCETAPIAALAALLYAAGDF